MVPTHHPPYGDDHSRRARQPPCNCCSHEGTPAANRRSTGAAVPAPLPVNNTPPAGRREPTIARLTTGMKRKTVFDNVGVSDNPRALLVVCKDAPRALARPREGGGRDTLGPHRSAPTLTSGFTPGGVGHHPPEPTPTLGPHPPTPRGKGGPHPSVCALVWSAHRLPNSKMRSCVFVPGKRRPLQDDLLENSLY